MVSPDDHARGLEDENPRGVVAREVIPARVVPVVADGVVPHGSGRAPAHLDPVLGGDPSGSGADDNVVLNRGGRSGAVDYNAPLLVALDRVPRDRRAPGGFGEGLPYTDADAVLAPAKGRVPDVDDVVARDDCVPAAVDQDPVFDAVAAAAARAGNREASDFDVARSRDPDDRFRARHRGRRSDHGLEG